MSSSFAELLEALRQSPDNIVLKKMVVNQAWAEGHLHEGAQYLGELVEHPKVLDNDASLGELVETSLQTLIQAEESGLALDLGQKIAPVQRSPRCLYWMARAAWFVGKTEEAKAYYQEAITRDETLKDAILAQALSTEPSKPNSVEPVSPMDEPKPIPLRHAMDDDDEDLDDDDEFTEPPSMVINTSFEDVGGLEDLKEQIRMQIIYPLQNPDLFRQYGKSIGGGMLMYGPPGCGKTHLARATAGECNASFWILSINEILDMYLGESEKKLHQLFEKARAKTPAIIFIDELDAMGGSRQSMRQRFERSITNQLLTELDGVQSNNDGILVLGATNSPWFVDSALKRPGRFDRTLFVPPPDEEARGEILHVHLRGKPHDTIDWKKVAAKTHRYSGADLKAVVTTAVEFKLQEAMKSGMPKPITTGDLMKALKQVRPTTHEWFETAKNYATYANEAGTYDTVLEYLKKDR